jgi:glycosyltransferase involved in cell wall biosynthesis
VRAPLSVVVPTKDRPAKLDTCLAALRADVAIGDEIVVVDSGSSDAATVAAVTARYDARLVRSDRAGASLARNLGWQAASQDLIAFIDDDVRVHPGWAAAMVAGFDDAAVEFVTGGVVVPVDQQGAERPVAITSRTVRTRLDRSTDGDLGATANLGIRRRALQAVGGFDERIGPGTWAASAEDLDLFDRLFRHDYLGMFEPLARAEHDQWRTRGQLLALDWRYGKGMGVRLAKLRAWDKPRARRLTKEALVTQGARSVVQDLLHGYEFGALTVAARTLATVLGMAVGAARRADS